MSKKIAAETKEGRKGQISISWKKTLIGSHEGGFFFISRPVASLDDGVALAKAKNKKKPLV